MTDVVLVCGAGGQLGIELQLTCPEHIELVACDRQQLDITDPDAIARMLDETGARRIINAAAYTAVDRAETEAAAAHQVNAIAPGLLAAEAAARGLRLLQVSTDFVFDGGQSHPYKPADTPNPLGIYGASKLEGEQAVLASGADALVLRTGWVYSRHGGNFVQTMLRLMAERDELSIVEDQVGTPTWARGLAQVCWELLFQPASLGVYHWSDAGVCSWFDLAVATRSLALELGLVDIAATLVPIPATDYPTPARRPAYSVLDKSSTRAALGFSGAHWQQQLRDMLEDLRDSRLNEGKL